MARRDSLEQEIDRVAALRGLDDEDELREKLRRALADRRPLVAGKAGRVAADRALVDLGNEIASALDRLLGPEPDELSEVAESAPDRHADPGCLGKTDLARALVDLDADSFDVFFRGARCVQMEPVWGGQVDAAAELRAYCGMGLARSADRRAGEVLADLLADPEPAARSGAARALAASGRLGAELLLRFKSRLGDEQPGVLLDVFAGLLEMEPRSGLEPILVGLSSPDELCFEAAAIALGSSRNPRALSALVDATEQLSPWNQGRRKVLFRAISLIRGDEAAEHLVAVVAEAPEEDALLVLEILGDAGVDPRLRDRLAEVVDARRSRELSRTFRALGDTLRTD